jgi:hypothetical protein
LNIDKLGTLGESWIYGIPQIKVEIKWIRLGSWQKYTEEDRNSGRQKVGKEDAKKTRN